MENVNIKMKNDNAKLKMGKFSSVKSDLAFPTPYTLHPTPSSRGFTLIEMIVAVSIFTVVMFVAVGSLLAITDANRKANAIRTTMDNLNFAMDSMARNLRTGNSYRCDGIGNCSSSGGSFIDFQDQSNPPRSVRYAYDPDAHAITVTRGDINGGFPLAITSSEVNVDSLTFYVSGYGTDGLQPRVVISIKGTAGNTEKIRTSFNVQTTISQRKVDS